MSNNINKIKKENIPKIQRDNQIAENVQNIDYCKSEEAINNSKKGLSMNNDINNIRTKIKKKCILKILFILGALIILLVALIVLYVIVTKKRKKTNKEDGNNTKEDENITKEDENNVKENENNTKEDENNIK